MDWEGSGRISPSGDTAADGADATAERGRDLDITYPGGGSSGGRNAGYKNLRRPSLEHC